MCVCVCVDSPPRWISVIGSFQEAGSHHHTSRDDACVVRRHKWEKWETRRWSLLSLTYHCSLPVRLWGCPWALFLIQILHLVIPHSMLTSFFLQFKTNHGVLNTWTLIRAGVLNRRGLQPIEAILVMPSVGCLRGPVHTSPVDRDLTLPLFHFQTLRCVQMRNGICTKGGGISVNRARFALPPPPPSPQPRAVNTRIQSPRPSPS